MVISISSSSIKGFKTWCLNLVRFGRPMIAMRSTKAYVFLHSRRIPTWCRFRQTFVGYHSRPHFTWHFTRNFTCGLCGLLPIRQNRRLKNTIYRAGLFLPCRFGVAVYSTPVDDVQGAHAPALDDAGPVEHFGNNGVPKFGYSGTFLGFTDYLRNRKSEERPMQHNVPDTPQGWLFLKPPFLVSKTSL